VLAPESPDRDTQAIDVRDLAAWLVTCAEQRRTGTFDASGPVAPYRYGWPFSRAAASSTAAANDLVSSRDARTDEAPC